MGASPKVAVAEVELAKEIMVKEFEYFRDRGMLVSWLHISINGRDICDQQKCIIAILLQGAPNLIPKALEISQGLVTTTGESWKARRQVLTPSFSGMKMKMILHNSSYHPDVDL